MARARTAKTHAPRALPSLPTDRDAADLEVDGRRVHVTNLRKPFWPELGVTKRDLVQYYVDVSPWLLPHVAGRAMVMKRYPNGWDAPFFFMKRAPTPRPAWIRTCPIDHDSKGVIHFPVIDDVATLVWVINLGCIDLNPWYARCDDADRPDYLHFDLDPGSAPFEKVIETALVLRDALATAKMPSFAKTSGSKGIHVYVPIERGPTQKDVWTVAKTISQALAAARPKLMTAEYVKAKRPPGRVLVDYNQNRWGSTLASIYSVRPNARACVSTPVTWRELERGVHIEDFRIDNVRTRLDEVGDLWAPVAPGAPERFDLGALVG